MDESPRAPDHENRPQAITFSDFFLEEASKVENWGFLEEKHYKYALEHPEPSTWEKLPVDNQPATDFTAIDFISCSPDSALLHEVWFSPFLTRMHINMTHVINKSACDSYSTPSWQGLGTTEKMMVAGGNRQYKMMAGIARILVCTTY